MNEMSFLAAGETNEIFSNTSRPYGSGEAADVLRRASRRRILIVEDELSLATFLGHELEDLNFAVDLAHDGATVLEILEKERYDLLILDLNLPSIDGMSLLQRVRPTYPRLPILILTACTAVENKVAALECGADDYLTKPFSLAELLARVNALTRRNSGMIPNCSTVGDLKLYRMERRVEHHGRRIELTPREFAILEYLMRNPGQPVSRATLFEEVWNIPSGQTKPSTNIVDVYVKYVRDKVDLPGEPKLIHTIRGVGYELRDVEVQEAQ